MATAIFVFIAIALGLMLFSSIQKDIPDELHWLRDNPVPKTAAGAQVQQYKGWTIAQKDGAVEISRYANNANTLVGILCHANTVEARVETAGGTTGTTTTEIRVNGGPPEQWTKGTGNNVFPVSTSNFLKALLATKEVTIHVSYKSSAVQQAVIATDGLGELVSQLPAGCRP